MIKPQPYLLKNTIQHYEWGMRGKNAFIPKLLNIKSEKDKPYAELWMGAHPKSPSRIVVDGREFNLDTVIRQYPKEMLGGKIAKRFSNSLPYLFKILSSNEALSIQVHPNKKQAIALHKKDPLNYPDNNQKHEIAIVLDSLAALIGFKPFSQIIKTLKEYPEIGNFIGERFMRLYQARHSEFISESQNLIPVQNQMLKQAQHDKEKIKSIFAAIIKKSTSDREGLQHTLRKLNDRIVKKKRQNEIEKYFIKLHKKYNADVGLLIIFFLNLVHLKTGEAIFTKPGVPHAYLKGNILECMSSSDNVIRAGLTQKYKDLGTLLKVLTFNLSAPKILKGKKKVTSTIYKTDAKEFEIEIFSPKSKRMSFENQIGPKILFVLEDTINFLVEVDGNLKSYKFSKGDSAFLPSILSNYKVAADRISRFILVTVPA